MKANVQYWSEIGSTKNYEDPFFVEQFTKYLTPNPFIVEYGCGYGRILQILKEQGFNRLKGYDIAPGMIDRAKRENPWLDCELLKKSGEIPLPDNTCDGLIASTVLCCTPDPQEQEKIIREIHRVLKPGGVLHYLDFLICDAPYYQEKI